jgi:hypothetical protein
VWAFLVACIVAVSVFAWQAEYFNAALSIGIVLIEVIVLVLNGLHCPLQRLPPAIPKTGANLDIYLPEWLARNTNVIFGALYVAGIAVAPRGGPMKRHKGWPHNV